MKVQLTESNETITFDTMGKLAKHLGISLSLLSLKFKDRHTIDHEGKTLRKVTKEDIETRSVPPRPKREKVHTYKEEESLEDRRRKQEWEEHLSQCCTRSEDGTTWLPNSLLKEFPQLINHTLPNAMR